MGQRPHLSRGYLRDPSPLPPPPPPHELNHRPRAGGRAELPAPYMPSEFMLPDSGMPAEFIQESTGALIEPVVDAAIVAPQDQVITWAVETGDMYPQPPEQFWPS